MKIIKYQKINSGEYVIELENGEKIKLFEDIILKENLLWKKEIDDIDSLLKKNSQYEIYDVALKRLSNHVECRYGIYAFLNKKGYDEKSINEVIDKLIKKGYLNDAYYAKCYTMDHINLSNDGPRKIKKHLDEMHIPDKLYLEYLDIDDKIWYERIKKYVDKNLKINKKSEYFFKNKMLVNLVNLGYEKEMINEYLSTIRIDNQEEIKKKEQKKIRMKLEKKYQGKELEQKIREKLYQKGFF